MENSKKAEEFLTVEEAYYELFGYLYDNFSGIGLGSLDASPFSIKGKMTHYGYIIWWDVKSCHRDSEMMDNSIVEAANEIVYWHVKRHSRELQLQLGYSVQRREGGRGVIIEFDYMKARVAKGPSKPKRKAKEKETGFLTVDVCESLEKRQKQWVR